MKKRLTKSLIVGILATGIMSIVLLLFPLIGLPKLSPPEMLSEMLGMSKYNGWAVHFIIGIIFTDIYTFFFHQRLKINSLFFKGIVFGLAVFIFAQIVLGIMGTFLPMPETSEPMVPMMIGSILAHFAFGISVAVLIGDPSKLAGIGFHDNH